MRALIAMSGGVDSSVAAFLMQREFECGGCTMHLRGDIDCPSDDLIPKDINDARAIAEKLGMPFFVFDFREKFQHCVIDNFVHNYEIGVTPNPCIDCNRYLKFGAIYEEGRKLGFDTIATGHYARIEEHDGEFCLKKGKDPAKDQSYVLYTLTQEQLSHTRFPLGELSKDEVRAIAEEQGFINARKKDSQDICVVPDRKYAAVIERYSGKTSEPGNFIDEDGNIWTWGNNTYGQLGLGDTSDRSVPTRVTTNEGPFNQISANTYYTAALDLNGKIYATGNSRYFGDDKILVLTPTKIYK